MSELQLKYIPIDEIKPYENNPKENDRAVPYVAESIKEFGFKNPVILSKDNVIVAGHTRIKAAKELGIEKIPCVYADDLTEEQIKAYRLADNKVSEIAEWNFGKLEEELADLEIDMSQFGWNEFELDMLEKGDITPAEYDEDISEYTENEEQYLTKKRVLITYDEEMESQLCEFLGVEQDELKVIYDFKELIK